MNMYWSRTMFLSLLLLVVLSIYRYLFDASFSILGMSETLAACSGFLFGFTFLLGPLTHYKRLPKRHLRYRMYLGLSAYGFALLYSLSFFMLNKDVLLSGFPQSLLEIDHILGLLAMAIFTIMALLSNARLKKAIVWAKWKRIMRTGYVAYSCLILRAVIVEGDRWWNWITHAQDLPPMRMLLAIFASGVILARLSMWATTLKYKTLTS